MEFGLFARSLTLLHSAHQYGLLDADLSFKGLRDDDKLTLIDVSLRNALTKENLQGTNTDPLRTVNDGYKDKMDAAERFVVNHPEIFFLFPPLSIPLVLFIRAGHPLPSPRSHERSSSRYRPQAEEGGHRLCRFFP